MAMRRLAVIDLPGAAQPLANADGSLALVFNGEIYNYRELRTELAAQGYAFRTQGDGEVILALYERHGLDFVHHLRGMFVIALWDARSQRVVLARDRMGEKPLYLHETPGTLTFASEMKALLRSGSGRVRPRSGRRASLFPLSICARAADRRPRRPQARRRPSFWSSISTPWARPRNPLLGAWRNAPRSRTIRSESIRERLDEAGRLALRADVPGRDRAERRARFEPDRGPRRPSRGGARSRP